MADDRYGGHRREGWQGRDDSIFSDNDDRRGRARWSGDFGRERGAGGDDDRGFFERAGDEVRSWFGDEEAERRREVDARRDEGRFPERSFEAGRGAFGGSGVRRSGDAGLGYRSGPGGSSFTGEPDGQRSFGGARSRWDDNYRAWRDRQIRQFDREYEDYCRERQQQFEQDFDSWRGSRLTQGGTSGQYGGGGPAETPEATGGAKGGSGAGSRSQAAASGTAGALGAETAGTATGGAGSAPESSGGGSSGRARS